MKEQDTGAMIYTQEDVDKILDSRNKVYRKSKERRLALKRLTRAHERTIYTLVSTLNREAALLNEIDRLRNLIPKHNRDPEPSKSWWPLSSVLRGE